MSLIDDRLPRMDAVRADAQRGAGVLSAQMRADVFAYATAQALGRDSAEGARLDADVRAFVDAVCTRAVSADVEGLKRAGRSDDFVYELAIVAAVAAGTARAHAGFAARGVS
jgi:hypothetical protein